MRLSLDEKPRMQALARTQPGLPATAGHTTTRTHDYVRHGTLALLAALDLDTGQVYYTCARRHRHQELLAFLRPLARRFPTQQVHLILDNYSPHRHHKVKAWRKANPRFHFHFTPTYSSWLNPIEHWFSALQRQVLARGSLADAAALRNTLGRYVRGRNRQAVPPSWKATADELLARIATDPKNLQYGALDGKQAALCVDQGMPAWCRSRPGCVPGPTPPDHGHGGRWWRPGGNAYGWCLGSPGTVVSAPRRRLPPSVPRLWPSTSAGFGERCCSSTRSGATGLAMGSS